jgi:ABC-type antimicrobial peptide transport system permease subunit
MTTRCAARGGGQSEFARKIFGSVTNAMGRYYKMEDGTRIQVVGIVEDGKYYQPHRRSAAGDVSPHPAIAHPARHVPGGALEPRSAATGAAPSGARCGTWIAGCLEHPNVDQGLDIALFPSRVATMALGVLGVMGAMLAITGIFGMAAYSVSKRLRELGIRIALGAQRKEVLQAALGRH